MHGLNQNQIVPVMFRWKNFESSAVSQTYSPESSSLLRRILRRRYGPSVLSLMFLLSWSFCPSLYQVTAPLGRDSSQLRMISSGTWRSRWTSSLGCIIITGGSLRIKMIKLGKVFNCVINNHLNLHFKNFLLPRTFTLNIRTLSPARHVYVPASDSLDKCIVTFLLLPSAWIVASGFVCISVPSLYHWTAPSGLDTSQERTSSSFSTTLVKRFSSGMSANVSGGTVGKQCGSVYVNVAVIFWTCMHRLCSYSSHWTCRSEAVMAADWKDWVLFHLKKRSTAQMKRGDLKPEDSSKYALVWS